MAKQKDISFMKITINNKQTEFPEGTTLRSVADCCRLPEKGVAVAVNNEMIIRDEWESHVVKDGDEIVILKAFCGG